MIRNFLKTQISNAWGLFESTTGRVAQLAAAPLRTALATAPDPVKSAASTLEQQFDRALQATVRAGEGLQRRAADIMVDVATMKPVSNALADTGFIPGATQQGCQSQPELEYLKSINDAGPPGVSLVTVVLAILYSGLNRHGEGIRQFEGYLAKYEDELKPGLKAIYLSCLALLRAASAQAAAAWELPLTIENIRRLLDELDQARALTEKLPDFDPNFYKVFPRWVSGLLLANLPWPFGDKKAAMGYLTWCEKTITTTPENKEQGFQFLRETYYNLSVLYRDAGNSQQAKTYLARSGFADYNRPPIQMATVFATTSDGVRDGIKQVKESVPGKVFTVSGFDLSEYNYFITADGSELVAVDAGSRADTCAAAYQYFVQYYARKYPNSRLPKLTKVFMTHYHWDHSGGHSVYSGLNPKVEFYSRSNYTEESSRARNQPPPWQWILGEKFSLEAIRSYKPTHTISEDTTLHLGGTTVRLILLPGGGGETPDGMFVFLPDYGVLYVGDFMVPWVGSPFVGEGDADALLETLDLAATIEPRPKYVLHGHWAVTSFYPTIEHLAKMRPHLAWLKEAALKEIYAGRTRTQILAKNLIPPELPNISEAELQFPFLAMREVFIERIYRQKIGYWGPRLENVDHLSEEEIGCGLGRHLQLSEDDFASGIERMLAAGDFELAGRTVTWALACYPKSPRLNETKQRVFLRLIQKYELLNVFKFAMYSEHIKLATPQTQ